MIPGTEAFPEGIDVKSSTGVAAEGLVERSQYFDQIRDTTGVAANGSTYVGEAGGCGGRSSEEDGRGSY